MTGEGDHVGRLFSFRIYDLRGMRHALCILLTCLICLNLVAQPLPPGAPAVIITEIMYDLPGVDESLEFIELRNPADTNERSLTGYRLTQGVEYSFPHGIIVPPKAFVLVAKDSVLFEATFGIPAYQWTNGDLSDAGEAVVLRNNFNQIADSVFYSNASPWPMAGGGTGASIVLCNDTTDGTDPQNWAAAGNNTGIVVNGVEIHANPGEECSIDNAVVTATENHLSIHPNPNNGTFTLGTAMPATDVRLEVYSMSGQLVLSTRAANAQQVSVDLDGGIYLVRSLQNRQVSYQRMVIVR